jgi:hypothetical protein
MAVFEVGMPLCESSGAYICLIDNNSIAQSG